jgi:Methyltransferase domain
MERYVEPEWLDALPPEAPAAVGSRRDLRRLNAWMGSARRIARALQSVPTETHPVQVVEIGAGEGDLLLRIARRLGGPWRGTKATLIDVQDLLSAERGVEFCEAGWKVSVTKTDVLDWSGTQGASAKEVVLANLFLHHFHARELERLLSAIKRRSIFFVAMEPRRSLLGLLFSRLVGFIGCNAVTRHDAPASVCAGFAGKELSNSWGNNDQEWQLTERRAGPFGHLFVAQKRNLKLQN